MSNSKTICQHFYSSALRKEMGMTIFLPENQHIKQALPVLYFLHGRNGDENIMFDAGINEEADRLINRKFRKPHLSGRKVRRLSDKRTYSFY
jgi:enterochelin esterase-like enzyme